MKASKERLTISDETRKKMSLAHTGRKHSQETKDKIAAARKNNPRKPFSREWRRKMSDAQRRRFKIMPVSEETKHKMSEAIKGEKNYAWKGDDASYCSKHDWVRRWLGTPDTCEICSKSGLKGKQIHWANKDHKYRRRLSDWIRLCRPCHEEYDKKLRRVSV